MAEGDVGVDGGEGGGGRLSAKDDSRKAKKLGLLPSLAAIASAYIELFT